MTEPEKEKDKSESESESIPAPSLLSVTGLSNVIVPSLTESELILHPSSSASTSTANPAASGSETTTAIEPLASGESEAEPVGQQTADETTLPFTDAATMVNEPQRTRSEAERADTESEAQ